MYENSIRAYQDKEFYYINKFLRENLSEQEFANKYNINSEKIIEIKQHISNIDKEFNIPIKNIKILYRGIHGNTIYSGLDYGFVSTSKILNVAQKFAGKEGIIYELRLDDDIQYIDCSINNIKEQEILLQRGLVYTIISQKKIKKNIYVITTVSNS